MSTVPPSVWSRTRAAPGVAVEAWRWLFITRGMTRRRYLEWRDHTAFATAKELPNAQRVLAAFDYLAWSRRLRRAR